MSSQLPAELRRTFESEGYVILRRFFSEEEVDRLCEDIVEAADKLEGKSGLNKGNLTFYSNVFKKSEAIRRFVSQERLITFLKDIIGPDFWVRWDQCVAKNAGGAAFPWHQDNAYNRLKDPHFQLWVAITEMTLDNGGLWLKPGSHRHGILPHRWEGNHLVCSVEFPREVFVDAQKGDVVLFSSLMLHHTKENVSSTDRWAYVVEYMSCDHYDPLVEGPFFIAAQNGQPVGGFVETYKGYTSVTNRLKYLNLTAATFKEDLSRKARKLLRR